MMGHAIAANGGSVVHLWWLHYFRFFSNIENFNWASVGLVALYHSMNMLSRGLSKSHTGCSYLWEVYSIFFPTLGTLFIFNVPEKLKLKVNIIIYLSFTVSDLVSLLFRQ